jgi:hypothetical protein
MRFLPMFPQLRLRDPRLHRNFPRTFNASLLAVIPTSSADIAHLLLTPFFPLMCLSVRCNAYCHHCFAAPFFLPRVLTNHEFASPGLPYCQHLRNLASSRVFLYLTVILALLISPFSPGISGIITILIYLPALPVVNLVSTDVCLDFIQPHRFSSSPFLDLPPDILP